MSEKIRAFLDTPTLAAYYAGDEAAARLFDPPMLDRAAYVTSPIVIQQLLLHLDDEALPRLDLDDLTGRLGVEILRDRDLFDLDEQGRELDSLRERDIRVHPRDYMNVFGARRARCDFFVTDDRRLLPLGPALAIRFVTPDEFLHEEALA